MTETKAGWKEAVGLAGSLYKPLLFILILALFSVYRVTDCSLYFNECFLGFVFVCEFVWVFFFNLKLFGLLCGTSKINISISKPWLSQSHRKIWSLCHCLLTSCTHFMFWSIDTKPSQDFHQGHRGASSPNWPSHECTPVQHHRPTPLSLEIPVSWLSVPRHVRCHLWGVWDPRCPLEPLLVPPGSWLNLTCGTGPC